MWRWLVLGVLGCAAAEPCRRLCAAVAPDQYSKSQCERGCRLFNIGMNTNWSVDKALDLNLTRDQCFQSCSEAYAENARLHCFAGCSEMLNLQKDSWFYFEQRSENEGILEVEVSLVSDPALWEQTLGSNGAYKIPQTFIRTMPLDPELPDAVDNKAWSPCVPPDNDIPKWFVATVAILLTFFTLYVSFTLPGRNDSMICDDEEIENRRRLMQEDYLCDGEELRKELNMLYYGDVSNKKEVPDDFVIDLLTLNEFLTEDYHVNVVPPPKYTLLPPDTKYEA